tara:strand:+ start:2048 stop:2227 length:180 start_codon:yes stop_codon:yes gene_type:complete
LDNDKLRTTTKSTYRFNWLSKNSRHILGTESEQVKVGMRLSSDLDGNLTSKEEATINNL